ncbi:formin-like protein 5 isoform X1 [Ricinus communis]|uniref:formin-like protein 5 isoform X1 n=1 Tax=Ricinus communis TaxID=3988 RepID=UPI00201ABC0F|nr:formin-like protein 5 isoform X1 [Ricinus communis]
MLTMLIQLQMIRMQSNYFMFLLILLCASLVGGLDYRKRTEQVFLSQLVDPVTGEVDESMGELLSICCRLELLNLKEADEDFNLCFPKETCGMASESNSEGKSLEKEHIWKLITAQHPQLKRTLLNCMRKNNILFHASRQGRSNSQHIRYYNSLFPRAAIPKRNLLQSIAETPSLASGSPFPSPAPSPDLAPSPESIPSSPPAPSPEEPFFPRIGDNTPPAPTPTSENSSAGPNSDPTVKPDSGDSKHKEIIIAVVVTAVVTFAFAALFFLCCTKICRRSSGRRQNDERPLLSLSLTDYSTGSSYKPFGVVASIKEEKAGQQSFNNNLSHDRKHSSLDSINSDALHVSVDETASLGVVGASNFSAESVDSTSNNTGLVPPPPGRVDSMPPLKPPPGRAVPLPPEPPASLRPPPRKVGPAPPPTPPRAPPPPAKASSSMGSRPPGPPPPPPMAPNPRPGPPPPPPSKGSHAPPRPPPPLSVGAKVPRPPTGSKLPSGGDGDANTPKAKLKPFFWDKVMANPEHSMVWHQIKSGSFQFNEEMIETLFGYAAVDRNKNEGKKESSSQEPSTQYIQILDTKKAQNLSILLRALNVTIEEVCDALREGNELPVELLQTLLKMAPTADEELKLRVFSGELSQLGPAERFLKALVEIPFAYKRLEALLFMCTLQEEVTTTKESFETLEVACKELRSSRLFLKLLEAVLKTGNRMNDGTFRGGAQAFKLDTLLKLADVKGADGKTTLLHFVVQEIIRSEGVRAARAAKESRTFSNVSVTTEDLLEDISPDTEEDYRSLGLQVVSRLSSELENVKKAANVDADSLIGTVAKLGHSLLKTKDFLNKDMKSLEGGSEFHETLKSFVQNAEVDVMLLLEEEKRIMALMKSTGDYFHGKAGKDEGLRLFVIVRDFLIILDKVCKQVGEAQKKSAKSLKKESSTASSHSSPRQHLSPDFRSRLFPAIAERRENSSSDDES